MSAGLPSGSPRYQKPDGISGQLFLGEGSFGCVLKYQRMMDKTIVAIKTIERKGIYEEQAEVEVAALKHLRSLDPDRCNLVRWFEEFKDKDKIYLVFEHLDISLYEFMKKRGFQHLQLMTIRPIVQQLANALNHLKAAGIIHADLKCENVMMLNHLEEPPRVKIIDFGLACKVSAAWVGKKCQSLHYRSLEIMLSLPFTEAIDMWSLGCMAAFMYLGTPLYPGRSECDMITYIVETQGLPPDNMLNHGRRTLKFFQKDNSWKLKFCRETGLMDNRRTRSLDDLKFFHAAGEETNNVTMFVVMLKGMLQLDGTKRMTPCQVLDHQFINCASSCSKMIDINQNKKQTNDNGKTVCRSLQQPPIKTANPIQLNPQVLNERSDNNRKRFQKTSAGQSTSSCSSQTQSCGFPKVERKMALYVRPDQRSSLAEDPRPSPRPSSNTLAERQAPIGRKRKSSDDGYMQPGKRTSGLRSDNDRKKFQMTSAGQSTSSCSSSSQGLAKAVSAEQTPSKGSGSSRCTPKRPKAPAKPILMTFDLKFRKKAQAIMKERNRQRKGSKRHAHCQK